MEEVCKMNKKGYFALANVGDMILIVLALILLILLIYLLKDRIKDYINVILDFLGM